MQAQFEAAAFRETSHANQSDYTNARYARTGDQEVGTPFPLYKQPAYYMTDWTPAGQTPSNLKRQMNLPTDNTLFRNTMEGTGVSLANKENTAWLYRSQTLANNGSTIACRNNTDCSSYPGTTCNGQFSGWNDSKGSQGNYCSITKYPELAGGVYQRKNTSEGGIGRGCTTDSDCGSGYSCNNTTDMFGKNNQGTGYCSQVYQCPDGPHFSGYPYNSGIPITPPSSQNNGGQGYATKEECMNNIVGLQDCKQDSSGNFFAVYQEFCPVVTNLRSNSNPQGMLPSTSMAAQDSGIIVPQYATNMRSAMGQSTVNAFSGWNINATPHLKQEMNSPLQYELSINPR